MADDELARRKGPSCYSLPLSASLAQPGTNLQEMRQEMCGLSIGWVGWHPTLNRAALLRTEAADKRARNRPQKQTPPPATVTSCPFQRSSALVDAGLMKIKTTVHSSLAEWELDNWNSDSDPV